MDIKQNIMKQKLVAALLALLVMQLAMAQVTVNKPAEVSSTQPTGTVTAVAVGSRMMGHVDVQATDAFSTQKGGRITFSGVYSSGGALSTYAAIQGKKYN